MIHTVWDELPKYYPGIGVDVFQVMPNHIHGIIVIVGAGPRACPVQNDGQPQGVAPTLSLPDAVHRFKISIVNDIRIGITHRTMVNHRIIGKSAGKNRRSIRLQEYDYSQAGAYFITICTQNRKCLFGDIVDDQMVLNDAGKMIHTVWDELPKYYPGIGVDVFQVMPNHIHGIIVIVGAGPRACPVQNDGQPQGVAPTLSLPDVVHRFKTLTTKRYSDGVKQYGWPRFNGKLWQRNYYEHIIRSENEFSRTREYIANNPLQWELDRENPNMQRHAGRSQEYPWT